MPPRPEGPSGPPADDDAGTRDENAETPDENAGPPGENVGPPEENVGPPGERVGPPEENAGPPEENAEPQKDGPGAGDVDERWAQIVDQLREVDGAGDGWTVGPGAAPAPRRNLGRVVRAAQPPPEITPGGPPAAGGRDWDGTAQYDEAEDAVDALEHFVPPDPAPVLGGNPLLTLAWAIVIGVPALYVVILIAWQNPPGWLPPVAGVAFLAGLTVLLWHMPHRRDDADDDSGAVV